MPMVAVLPSGLIHSCSLVYLKSVGYGMLSVAPGVAPVSSLKGLDVYFRLPPALPCRAFTFRLSGLVTRKFSPRLFRRDFSCGFYTSAKSSSVSCKTAWGRPAPSRLDREFQPAPSIPAPHIPLEHTPARCFSLETEHTIRWSRSLFRHRLRSKLCSRRGRFRDPSFPGRSAFASGIRLWLFPARRGQ